MSDQMPKLYSVSISKGVAEILIGHLLPLESAYRLSRKGKHGVSSLFPSRDLPETVAIGDDVRLWTRA